MYRLHSIQTQHIDLEEKAKGRLSPSNRMRNAGNSGEKGGYAGGFKKGCGH
jgi:hypothetical protein